MTVDIAKLKIDREGLRSAKPARSRVRSIVLLLLGITAGLLGIQWYVSRPVAIEVATVTLAYPSSSYTLLNASGYVVAQRKAALAAKTTGRLDWLGVEEGSRVKSGEVIARLESRDAEAVRNQSAAALAAAVAVREQALVERNDAARSLKRLKELLAQGVVSQADYDTAEARQERSVAALAAAEANLSVSRASLDGSAVQVDYTRIRAPFDGVVLTKNADVGDIVTPLGAAANAKASVVTIADLSSLLVEVDVSESSLAKVKAGQPCIIQLDALPGSRFRGGVHAIVPTADRSKATVMVKVNFTERDARILPEMSAKVAFLEHQVGPGEEQAKTMLPRGAIFRKDGAEYVYLLSGDAVMATRVQIVPGDGDLVEVRGLKPGDKVALKPLEKLSDRTRVTTASK